MQRLASLHRATQDHDSQWLQVTTAWEFERTAEFDTTRADNLRTQALTGKDESGEPVDINALSEQWAALPPAHPYAQQDAGSWDPHIRALLHPKHIPFPFMSIAGIPATVTNGIKAEVDEMLARATWKPALARNIANSPRFAETLLRMQETLQPLRDTLARANTLHAQIQGMSSTDPDYLTTQSSYHDAMRQLAVQTNAARQLCVDHEMATGLLYKAGTSNLGTISVNVMQNVAAAIATVMAAPVAGAAASMGLELMSNPARQFDLARSNNAVNWLNLMYADISSGQEALPTLWEGPMQARRALVDVALSYDLEKVERKLQNIEPLQDAASLEKKAKLTDKKKRLQGELDLVQQGALANLHRSSRTAALLVDTEKLRAAAYEALMYKCLLPRLGAGGAAAAITQALGAAATGMMEDAVATNAGTESGVAVSTVLAQSAADAREAPALVAEPEEDAEALARESPAPLARTRTWMTEALQPIREGTGSVLEGAQQLGQFVKKEGYNAGMGIRSAVTYYELSAVCKEASELLKTAGGITTPPDRGPLEWPHQDSAEA